MLGLVVVQHAEQQPGVPSVIFTLHFCAAVSISLCRVFVNLSQVPSNTPCRNRILLPASTAMLVSLDSRPRASNPHPTLRFLTWNPEAECLRPPIALPALPIGKKPLNTPRRELGKGHRAGQPSESMVAPHVVEARTLSSLGATPALSDMASTRDANVGGACSRI
jgi:hypothetical protein